MRENPSLQNHNTNTNTSIPYPFLQQRFPVEPRLYLFATEDNDGEGMLLGERLEGFEHHNPGVPYFLLKRNKQVQEYSPFSYLQSYIKIINIRHREGR